MHNQDFTEFQESLLDSVSPSNSERNLFGSFALVVLSAGLLASAQGASLPVGPGVLWLWAWLYFGWELIRVTLLICVTNPICHLTTKLEHHQDELSENLRSEEIGRESRQILDAIGQAKHKAFLTRVATERSDPLLSLIQRCWLRTVDVLLVVSLFWAGARVLPVLIALLVFSRWNSNFQARRAAWHYVKNLTPESVQYVTDSTAT